MTPKEFLEIVIGRPVAHELQHGASAVAGFWFAIVTKKEEKFIIEIEYTGSRVKSRACFTAKELNTELAASIMLVKAAIENVKI